MFAAQAGAKHVYGIDMSDIISDAREIVQVNGFADKITLIQGKVEEITLPVGSLACSSLLSCLRNPLLEKAR
jgi:protein arginine N-methyltransferase 1